LPIKYQYVEKIRKGIMNKQAIRYAAYILLIMGLIGVISQSGITWARYAVLALGIILYLITLIGSKSK